MGRCTRSATDFAVVLWLGQSLVDIASSKSALREMPAELQRELKWGIDQVKGTSKKLETKKRSPPFGGPLDASGLLRLFSFSA